MSSQSNCLKDFGACSLETDGDALYAAPVSPFMPIPLRLAQLRHGLVERTGGEPLLGEAQDHIEVLRAFFGAGEARIAR